MRLMVRTIIFVFLSLIFISKPIVADASITAETVKNIGTFYAESTSSLLDETNEKIYAVRDFYAPLFVDTAKSLKGIFDGAFIASDTALNSVVSLGRGALNAGEYQIQNTGESIGSAVASAGVAFDNVRGMISYKTNGAIETTNVAVNKLVKQVASSLELPKISNPNTDVVAKSDDKPENPLRNIASAKSAINFELPDAKELLRNVYNVYARIGNEFLNSAEHSFTRTGESWSEIASVAGDVIANVNKNIDEATVALGNAGYVGVKNVLDGGTIVGNGVLNSSETIITKTGDTVANVLMKTGDMLSGSTENIGESITNTKNGSLAGVGSIWNFIINKISEPLVPFFTDSSLSDQSEPINIIGGNTETKGTNTVITNNNTIVEKIIERPEYFTISNADGLNDLRLEMISLNNNSVESLKSLIALQAYRNSESIYKSIDRSSGGSSNGATGDIDADTLSIGTLTGILEASNGVVSATSVISIINGGTGTSTAPTYGKLLMGNAGGTYDLVATSSLGISSGGDSLSLTNWYATTTDALDEGSVNQYWTNTRFDNRLSATTTLPNILTLGGLTSFGTSGATTTSAGNLNVAGNINFTGALLQNDSPFVGSQWTTSSSDIYYNTGNVGIGTTTPGTPLHLSSMSNDILTIQSQIGGAGNTANLNFQTYDTMSGLKPTASISAIDDNLYSSALAFLTKNPGTETNGLLERMRISSDGNVGIGSTTPGSLLSIGDTDGINFYSGSSATSTFGGNLSVNGNINLNGALLQDGSAFVGSQWTTTGSDVYYNTGSVGVGSTTPYGLLSVNPDGITGPSFVVGSSTATQFVVTNAGYVGVGTAAPAYQFEITGDFNTTAGVIKTGGTTRITNTGGFSASVGNVSTPGYNFGTVDSNTGMYRPSADNLGFVTAGVERLLIGSSGFVGVASSTPYGLFSINPDGISGPSFVVGSSTATNFIVTNGGNIGIGTTTPGSLFSISGIANFTTATTSLYGTGGINIAGGCFSINGTCVGGGGGASLTGTTGQLAYFSGTDTAVGTSTMFISTAGNVGIGTTSPSGPLSISGQRALVFSGYGADQTTGGTAFGTLNYIGGACTSGGAAASGPSGVFDDNANTCGADAGGYNSTTAIGYDFSAANLKRIRKITFRYTSNSANIAASSQTLALQYSDDNSSYTTVSTFTPDRTLTTVQSFTFADTGSHRYWRLYYSSGSVSNFWVSEIEMMEATFSTAQDTFLEVATNGKVGIGTLSPSNTLHIAATDSVAISFSDLLGVTTGWTIGQDVTNSGRFSIANSLALGTTDRFTIDTSGNIGIGTTTPGSLFSIGGIANFTTATTTLYGTGGINISGGCFSVNGTCVGGGGGGASLTGTTGQLAYFSGTDTAVGTSTIFISTAGNVGIGSTTPFGQFSINPNGITGPSFVVGSSTATRFIVTNGGNVGIGTTTPWASFAINPIAGLASNQFVVGSSTATNFIINNMGYVGIGTTSPYARLTVQGEAVALNFTATSTTATSTFAGGLNVGNGAIVYDYSSGLTSIANSSFGAMTFDTDSGIISWIDMPVTSAAASSTVESYSASIDGNPIFTVYGLSDGAGAVNSTAFGVGTTSPWRKLSVSGTVGFANLTGSTGAGSLCLSSNNEVVYNSGSDSCLPSLRSMKNSIAELDFSATEKILALNSVSFVYNGDMSSTTRYGFIAEDAALVDSHFGTYNAAGQISGVDDRSLISVLVKAFKELKTSLDSVLAWFTGGVFNVQGDVCVDDVCVTREEFKQILLNNGGSYSVTPTPEPDSEDSTSTTTDSAIDSETTATTTPETDSGSDTGSTASDTTLDTDTTDSSDTDTDEPLSEPEPEPTPDTEVSDPEPEAPQSEPEPAPESSPEPEAGI